MGAPRRSRGPERRSRILRRIRVGSARAGPAPRPFRHPSPPMPTTERLVLRSWRPSDRAPFARLNADPEVVRFLNDGVPFTQAQSDELLDAIQAHWEQRGFGLWCAAAREDPDECLGFVGLAVPSFLPSVLPAVEVGWRLARPAWGRGPRDRGRASVVAPRLRGARPRGGDLDHRPGQRALDPRGARSSACAAGPITCTRERAADCSHTRFSRTMRLFHPSPLDPPRERLAYVRSRRGTEPQRARPWGCEARRSEVTALLREPTWRRAPRAARDRVAFVKAHLVE